MCLDRLFMGRLLIVLAVMLGGATMRFSSCIMMLGSLGVVIMGHRFSNLLSRKEEGNCSHNSALSKERTGSETT